MSKAAQDDLLARAVYEQRADALCAYFFGDRLTYAQAEIAADIAFRRDDRIAISAATQYGKTYAVARGVNLALLLDDSIRVGVVSPSNRQSAILRGYVVDGIMDCPELAARLDLDAGAGVDRLKKEVSKTRFTFKGGGEIEFLSAEGEAKRLMGLGSWDVLIEDEAGLIPDHVYTSKITRMRSKSGCVHVMIGNPWERDHHFYRACTSDRWKFHRIDWRVGVREGRYTEDFIDEQRDELPPVQFQVLYDAEFPDHAEDQLIPAAWVKRSIRDDVPDRLRTAEWWPRYGVDVAEAGADQTVVTPLRIYEDEGLLLLEGADQAAWHIADTMETAARIRAMTADNDVLQIDANGVGKGVADDLADDRDVLQLKTGRSARHKDRFADLGSEILWGVRERFEKGAIRLVDPHPDLLRDLGRYRWELRSGRIKVVVDGGKSQGTSPDRGDSFAYACHGPIDRPTYRVVKARDPLRL